MISPTPEQRARPNTADTGVTSPGAAPGSLAPAPDSPSPALRFLAEGGRLVDRRVAVLILSLGARLGLLRGFSIWPDARWPMRGVDLGSRQAADWLRETFPERRSSVVRTWIDEHLDAGLVAALRARSVLVGAPASQLIEATETALGRTIDSPRVALYSPSGMRVSKVVHFVFERGRQGPAAVVINMAEPRMWQRLRSEVELVEQVRERLSPEPVLREALPLSPLLAKEIGNEYFVVMPLDPLAGETGGDCRDRAMEWLREFQIATGTEAVEWSTAQTEDELRGLDESWESLRPGNAAKLVSCARRMLRALHGSSAPACVVHGDYWRGNIALSDGRLRVFDWEWTELSGHPALDLLGFELGEIRRRADAMASGELEAGLSAALEAVSGELERRELDPAAAPALLAPMVGRLAERGGSAVQGPEDPLIRLMSATESVLAARC